MADASPDFLSNSLYGVRFTIMSLVILDRVRTRERGSALRSAPPRPSALSVDLTHSVSRCTVGREHGGGGEEKETS